MGFLGGPSHPPSSFFLGLPTIIRTYERSAMSNVFTLDALREETIRRYSPTEVDLGDGDTVELKSLLRLGEKDRKAVLAAIEEINDIESDDDDEESVAEWSEAVIEACSKIFRIISSSPKKLISGLDHDDPTIKANLYTAVLTRWIGESQVGEAKPSPA